MQHSHHCCTYKTSRIAIPMRRNLLTMCLFNNKLLLVQLNSSSLPFLSVSKKPATASAMCKNIIAIFEAPFSSSFCLHSCCYLHMQFPPAFIASPLIHLVTLTLWQAHLYTVIPAYVEPGYNKVCLILDFSKIPIKISCISHFL